MNILILGAGGNVSQGIIRTILNSGLKCKLITACVSERAFGFYMSNKSYISPYANDANFIPWLIEICNKEAIEIILTGVEENIEKIAQNIEILNKKTNAIFISSTPEQLKIGNDKLLTAQWLKNNQCNFPSYADLSNKEKVAELIKKEGFPLIAKPRKGKGSNGVIIINNKKELNKISNLKNYVLQKYLGDEDNEYTVACYYDKYNKFKDMIIMKRRLENGTTIEAESVFNQEIYDECKKICEKFKPIGPLNIQLRVHNSKPVCFELNVRFSGTTPIRALLGYNDLEALIKEYVLNQSIDNCFNIKKGKVIRYLTEQYVHLVSINKFNDEVCL